MPNENIRKIENAKFERVFNVVHESIDVEKRTVELAYASETPYERWFGIEILDCTAGAVRRERLARGANLLLEHEREEVVGVIDSDSIDADKVCRAVVRFGKSAKAEEIFQDVIDSIRTNVSVGYLVHKAVLESTIDGLDTYRVTDWEPYEISLVSIPADITVGVGRSADKATTKTNTIQEEKQMSDTTLPTDTKPADTPVPTPAVVMIDKTDHARNISAAAKANPALADLALRSIQEGKTTDEFQRDAIALLSTKGLQTADIGLTQKETREFSFIRAINALANPASATAQKAAQFEIECSQAVATKTGRESRGLFIPNEVKQRDLKALNVGTATAGGHTVATTLAIGSFIDILRNAMVIDKLGVTTLTGLVGNLDIPKQTGGATAYWVGEGEDVTASAQTFGQVQMNPKTVGAYTDITRRMLLQSSLDAESFVQRDLATTLGLAIQQAAINGSGENGEPSGLLKLLTASVVGGTNGAAPTFAHMVDLETAVSVGNADVGTLGYLTNSKVRGKLKKTETFSTTNGQPVWVGNEVNGYSAKVTNAVPSNLTKGSATACSPILFGNWSDLVIGMWGVMDLLVDPYTLGTSGGVRVITMQDVDIAVRNIQSFAVMLDALTA